MQSNDMCIDHTISDSIVEVFKNSQDCCFPVATHDAKIHYSYEENKIVIEFYQSDGLYARMLVKMLMAGAVKRPEPIDRSAIEVWWGKYCSFFPPGELAPIERDRQDKDCNAVDVSIQCSIDRSKAATPREIKKILKRLLDEPEEIIVQALRISTYNIKELVLMQQMELSGRNRPRINAAISQFLGDLR